MTFNLITDPWITVSTTAGDSTVSIQDALTDTTGQILDVRGETPVERAAILRLLLAILYQALEGHDRNPGVLPVDTISAYLTKIRDRFELYDPDMPFMQIPCLTTTKGPQQIGELAPEPPVIFSMSLGRTLSNAQAARWLVTLHAADLAGIKGADRDDPRAIRGKTFPIGAGWLVHAGAHMLTGKTLAQTLLLNLAPAAPSTRTPWDTPAIPITDYAPPTGTADLYTWQSRRVLLNPTPRIAATVCNGAPTSTLITPKTIPDAVLLDPMAVWFINDTHKVQPWRPHQLATWVPLQYRLPGILTRSHRLGVLDHLIKLVSGGYITPDTLITLDVTAIETDSRYASARHIIHDQVTLRAGILTGFDPDGANAVIRALTQARNGINAYGRLAKNLTQARGGDHNAQTGARSEARDELTHPFIGQINPFLENIPLGNAAYTEADRWCGVIRDQVTGAGQSLIEDASGNPHAIFTNPNQNREMNIPKAESLFFRDLNNIFFYSTREEPNENIIIED